MIWPDASFLMVEANAMHKHRLEAQLARLQKRGGTRHAYAIAVLANETGKRSLFVPRPEHRAAAHTGTSLFRQVPSGAKFMREERDVQPLDALLDEAELAVVLQEDRELGRAPVVDLLVRGQSQSALVPHSASERPTCVPLPDCPGRPRQTTLTPPRSGRVDLEAPQIFERVGEVIFERVEEVLGEALRAHAGGRRVEDLEQVV